MTNTLTTVRSELRDLLTDAGLTAIDYLPERPQPPIAIVAPGSTYVQRGDRFGQHRIGLSVLLLTRTATNEVANEELDEMVAKTVISVFNADRYSLTQVEAPNTYQLNNATYLGCIVDVSVTDVLEVS